MKGEGDGGGGKQVMKESRMNLIKRGEMDLPMDA